MQLISPKLLFFIIVALLCPNLSIQAQKTNSKPRVSKTLRSETIPPKNLTLTQIQKEIFDEINLLRSNPEDYAKTLIEMRKEIKDNIVTLPNGKLWKMKEGISALDDAINALKTAPKVKSFVFTGGLTSAADLQLTDLKENISLGHRGKDGGDVETRLNKFGYAGTKYAENIAYHSKDAKSVVLTMLIDDNFKSRSHRKNLLSTQFSQIGIVYGTGNTGVNLCVIVFADGFMDKLK